MQNMIPRLQLSIPDFRPIRIPAGSVQNTAISTATREVTRQVTRGILGGITGLFGGNKK